MSELASHFLEVERLCEHEQPKAALALLREQPFQNDWDLAQREHWRWLELVSRRLGADPEDSLDGIILDAKRDLSWVETPRQRALRFRLIARGYATKRCETLALDAARSAREACPSNALGLLALAETELSFDRRAQALEFLAEARTFEEPERALLATARLAYTEGDFETAIAAAKAAAAHDGYQLDALRWQLACTRVRSDWRQALELVDDILARTEPDGQWCRSDRLLRANLLYRLERLDDARSCYAELWRDNEKDGVGRFARAFLNTLERGEREKHERIELDHFPTTAQKHNYCGPASLELVLRHLGIELDQDAIAASVKLPNGSPVLRLTRYLEAQGLSTRRFEWNRERLAVCLRHGLPVILEEEYSTTTHVAVLTGMDLGVDLLTVQDPMTHVPRENLLSTQQELGELFGHGAILAFRPDPTLEAELDAAGIVDCEHFRLYDSCAEQTQVDGIEGAQSSPLPTDEVQRRCRVLEAEQVEGTYNWRGSAIWEGLRAASKAGG
ncbi:MAG: cysteine peptidase family C39 domain-containing protein [Myxococcota bacterium]|jgi:tetratricopeptide (TPR) repeat protein|nr:cysteine peptidase family C39 domain-containing protein [Myxococcota bacterium]